VSWEPEPIGEAQAGAQDHLSTSTPALAQDRSDESSHTYFSQGMLQGRTANRRPTPGPDTLNRFCDYCHHPQTGGAPAEETSRDQSVVTCDLAEAMRNDAMYT